MTDDRFQSVPGAVLPVDTTAEQLAALAATRPDLWDQIWHHPNSYDGLRDWMAQSYAAQQQHGQVTRLGAAAPQPVSPSFEATLRGTDPDANAPSFVTSPNETQAKPRKRRRGLAIVASIAVVALALGGAGMALALTGKLDQWLGGSSSKKNAVPAADVEQQPSFVDGVEVKWALSGEDLGPEAGLWGHLPRMTGPINQAERADQPIQLESGVLVHYNPNDSGGDVPASWALLDNETGEPIWVKTGWGYPNSCATKPDFTAVVCDTSFVGGSKLIGLDDEGIRFDVDAPFGAVHFDGDDAVVQNDEGVTNYSTSGKLTSEEQVGGKSAATVSNAEQPDCVWLRAAQTTHYLGSGCGSETVLTQGDAFNWAIIENGSPKIVLDDRETVTLFDAESGKVIWNVEGVLPGHFQDPQIVHRSSGDAMLVQRAQGNTLGFLLVDLATGEELLLPGASSHDRVPVVAGDEILLFEGDPPVGDPITSVKVLSAETGDLLVEHSIEPVYEVVEIIGGPRGVLFGHPKCTSCSTAEGSHVIDRYTFVGPAAGGGDVTDSDIELVASEAPDFVPACPGDTILLAWMELTDGWIVVCGVDANTPTYVAYQPGDEGKPRYSNGATDPTGKKAHAAVAWDKAKQRYLATMADGSKLILDYPLGTATLRDATTTSTVNEQERFVRYVFVPMGTKERVIDEVANQNGAFDVKAPKSTAEDQIRYMIEVLEKAYAGRAMLKDALPKLAGCTAGVGGYGDTIAAMQAVRDNRAQLLTALDAMPVDKIPEGKQLLADLTSAIELSHQANVEYVAWAEAANANGCASLSATGKAAADASDAPKAAFATRWNSIVAARYGVRTFDGWYI